MLFTSSTLQIVLPSSLGRKNLLELVSEEFPAHFLPFFKFQGPMSLYVSPAGVWVMWEGLLSDLPLLYGSCVSSSLTQGGL